MHATDNSPGEESFSYAYFLDEVLKQLYLEKIKQICFWGTL